MVTRVLSESLLPFIAGMFGYMLKRWLGDVTTNNIIKPLVNLLKKKFIKTERDMAVYLHGYNEMINKKKAGGG
jgi:hypothetical protein